MYYESSGKIVLKHDFHSKYFQLWYYCKKYTLLNKCYNHGIYIIGRHGSPRSDIFRISCEFHSINEKNS